MSNFPECGKGSYGPPLNTKCDLCGCAFCYDGNCTGTVGDKALVRSGSGRSANMTCPKCGKGKLKNSRSENKSGREVMKLWLTFIIMSFSPMLLLVSQAEAETYKTYLIDKSSQSYLPICFNGPIKEGDRPLWEWGDGAPTFNAIAIAENLNRRNATICSDKSQGVHYLRAKQEGSPRQNFGECNLSGICADFVLMTRLDELIDPKGRFCLFEIQPLGALTVWECDKPAVYANLPEQAELSFIEALDKRIGEAAFPGSAYKLAGFALREGMFWGLSNSTRHELKRNNLADLGFYPERCSERVRIGLENPYDGAARELPQYADNFEAVYHLSSSDRGGEGSCQFITDSQKKFMTNVDVVFLETGAALFDTALWLDANLNKQGIYFESDMFTEELLVTIEFAWSLRKINGIFDRTPQRSPNRTTFQFNFDISASSVKGWGAFVHMANDEGETGIRRVSLKSKKDRNIVSFDLADGFFKNVEETKNFLGYLRSYCVDGLFIRLEGVSGDRYDSEFKCESEFGRLDSDDNPYNNPWGLFVPVPN